MYELETRRYVVLAVALVAASACSDDGGSTPPADTDAGSAETRPDATDASLRDPDTADRDVSHPDAADNIEPDVGRFAFPDDFLFGTAISGFQVEMGCPTLSDERCLDDGSDWYRFVTTDSMVADGDTHLSGDSPSLAGGFRELYPEDLRRADEQLASDAFRFSIEWSRIFPEPTDDLETLDELREAADPQALEYYHDLLAELDRRDMTPVVTVNHYTLPTWLHDPVACHDDIASCEDRGWAGPDRLTREAKKYARFLADEFGDEVDRWATLNEPMAVLIPGYVRPTAERTNPPSVEFELETAKRVLRSIVEGHAAMYDAIEAHDEGDADGDGTAAEVGMVYNVSPVEPADPDDEDDRQAAENVDYLYNRLLLNAVVDGKFDDDLDGEATVRGDLEGRLDWVGVNYYATVSVEGTGGSAFPGFSPLLTFDPASLQMDWNRPDGLYEALVSVHDDYGLPIVVTENGTTVDPQGGEGAGDASGYLVRHLDAVDRAMTAGVPVEGYLYWSLLDTYEWNKGMGPTMGLYGFDPQDPDKTRVERPAVETFRQIADTRTIPPPLRDEYL